jgi:Ni/Co efflux regulator RcnB
LAKKGSGCLPLGQAKNWKKGESLPANLTYLELPRSVVLTLSMPQQGYKNVRVASDILLIAIGTNMVMDAIEDLVQ